MLNLHELNVNEIVRIMDMGQSRISRHLKIMSDSGLVTNRRDGQWVYYRTREGRPAENMVQIVKEMLADEDLPQMDLKNASAVIAERHSRSQVFFDDAAGSWDELKRSVFGEFALNRVLADLVENTDTTVDVGCGTGDLIPLLIEKSRLVIGVDSSFPMIEMARKRFNGMSGIDLRLGEVEHLPLKDDEADLVIMSLVLHHLSEPLQGIREAYRILDEGKTFILADFERHAVDSMRESQGDQWLGFEKATVKRWLEKSGFVLTDRNTHRLNADLALTIHIAKKETTKVARRRRDSQN